MTFSFGLFITFHVLVLIFVVESLRRIWRHKRELNLAEDPRTLPFGFVRLRHVIILYIVAYVAWVVLTIWLYMLFIQSPPSGNVILAL